MEQDMIYDLKLHETTEIKQFLPNGYEYLMIITRVAGGWLYTTTADNNLTFVPFNNEFQDLP